MGLRLHSLLLMPKTLLAQSDAAVRVLVIVEDLAVFEVPGSG